MVKLTIQEKITADVDDAIYDITKNIQKKYKLRWNEAATYTNYGLRLLMLSFPKLWLKNGSGFRKKSLRMIDHAVYDITKNIQKKYKLLWDEATTHTNYWLRILMLSCPDKWLENGTGFREKSFKKGVK